MKNLFFYILPLLFLFSCAKSLRKIKSPNKVSFHEIKGLEIGNDNLYELLDLVISETKSCKYFNNQIPYLYAFSFSQKEVNGKIIYQIFPFQSVEMATGLFLNRNKGKNYPMDMGGFYYRDFLFVVSTSSDLGNVEERYPFLKKNSCPIRIMDSPIDDENIYASSIEFIMKKELFQIVDIDICGLPILIE